MSLNPRPRPIRPRPFRPRPGADLSRLPIAFDLREVSVEEGVRAGLSVAALVGADYVLGAPVLLEAALAALLTCLCDAGGPVSRRVPALLAFAVAGAVLTTVVPLLRPAGYAVIPLAAAGIFAFSLLRIYGQAGQQAGNLLSVVLVLGLDHSYTTIGPALHLGSAFGLGGVWALLLTMVIWRLHPNRPMRQGVARVYLALAAMAEDLRDLLARADGGEAQWESHARAHRRAVRDAIEQARETISARLHNSGPVGQPAAENLLRLDSADQIFAGLIALTEVLEAGVDAASVAASFSLTVQLAGILRRLAPHIIDDREDRDAAIEASIAALAGQARDLPAGAPVRHVADLLIERLQATLNLNVTPVIAEQAKQGRRTDALLAPLRANWSWQSAALRHAARAALVCAAGFAITFTWPTSYQHWLTITLVLTLQPYYAITLQRALERIGGTVAGGVIAAVLGLVCHDPLSIAAAIFPLSVLALSLRAVNYGLYIAALTPVIVLLVELAHPGHGQFVIAAMRALYTAIGGGLAVLGCIFLWPSWEPDRLAAELREAVRCHCRFAELEVRFLQGEGDAAGIAAARRAAGMASNNLEASLSRALLEPGRAGRARLDAALVVDAALRRMAGRLSAMQIDPTLRGGATLARWRDWIASVAPLLGEAVPPALPPRPEALPENAMLRDSLLRIARQFELSAGALRRFAAG